jgi:hypothetical protein
MDVTNVGYKDGDWIYWPYERQSTVSFEHGNKYLGCKKDGTFSK